MRQADAGPKNGAKYPSGDLGKAMAVAARVVRGDVGVEVITVDHGNWDMHTGLGTLNNGQMVRNTDELATAVAAFFTDIGGLADKVTLVALSEFGRRVKENSNVGLDHGYGNVMFLAGAGVKGGKVLRHLAQDHQRGRLRPARHHRLPQRPGRGGGLPVHRQHSHGVPELHPRAGGGHAGPVALRARLRVGAGVPTE